MRSLRLVVVGLTLLSTTGAVHAKPTQPAVGGKARAEAILDDVMERLWSNVDLHWHKGEVYHIMNLQTMVIAARPHFVEAVSTLTWLLWSNDRDSEAVAVYDQALRKNPDSWALWDDYGQYWLIHRKDYKKASYYYEKAAAMPGAPNSTRHALAHAYEKSGRLDSALNIWQRLSKGSNDLVAGRNLTRLQNYMKSHP